MIYVIAKGKIEGRIMLVKGEDKATIENRIPLQEGEDFIGSFTDNEVAVLSASSLCLVTS